MVRSSRSAARNCSTARRAPSAVGDGPFTTRQLTRLDEAITLSSRETGLTFSVYVGELKAPTRAHAEALFERLTDEAVLLAVSPGQRALHIVTGPESSKRLPNRACALAALAMRAPSPTVTSPAASSPACACWPTPPAVADPLGSARRCPPRR